MTEFEINMLQMMYELSKELQDIKKLLEPVKVSATIDGAKLIISNAVAHQ